MIPDFKTYIGESVWADIHRRSTGETIRKEDDVDLLDAEDFCDYLKSRYYEKTGLEIEYESPMTIIVPILQRNTGSIHYLSISLRFGNILISPSIKNDVYNNIYIKLKDEYFIDKYSDIMIRINPKDGSDVTNNFFVKVIDFIIDNTNKDNLLIYRK